ncbi:MAG: radical SAM protein [Candidatus Methanofastidiosia archaeon]
MYVSKYNILLDIDNHTEKILINPLSQSIDVVDGDDEMCAYLKGAISLENMKPSDRDYLLQRGYLFNEPEEEENLIHDVIKKDDSEEYPCDFLLYPTFHCNFRCTYCFQSELPKYSFISIDYVNKAFEAIESICKDVRTESPLLYLFGGEPLLKGKKAQETITYTLQQACNRGYRTAVVTNGSNVQLYSSLLRKYEVEFIQITLDGPQHIHDKRRIYANGKGTFNDIKEGIESLLGSDIKILVRINLDSQNIDYIPEFADFVYESGWDKNDVTVFVGPYRDLLCRSYEYQLPEHVMLRRMFTFYQENPVTRIIKLLAWPGADYILHFLYTRELPPPRVSYCISSYGRFGFDAEGYMYACGNAAGNTDYAIGRYYPEVTFDEERVHIWRKRRFITMPYCRECELAFLCGGGCTLQSLLKFGGKKPFCPEILENLKVAVTYYFEKIVGD